MSLPKQDLHIRVSDECRAAIRLLADVAQQPDATWVSALVEEAVLGRFHALRVAARRLSDQGLSGRDRE